MHLPKVSKVYIMQSAQETMSSNRRSLFIHVSALMQGCLQPITSMHRTFKAYVLVICCILSVAATFGIYTLVLCGEEEMMHSDFALARIFFLAGAYPLQLHRLSILTSLKSAH